MKCTAFDRRSMLQRAVLRWALRAFTCLDSARCINAWESDSGHMIEALPGALHHLSLITNPRSSKAQAGPSLSDDCMELSHRAVATQASQTGDDKKATAAHHPRYPTLSGLDSPQAVCMYVNSVELSNCFYLLLGF